MKKPFYTNTQNYSENIALLKASTVAYNNAKRNEFRFSIFFVMMSVLYPVVYIGFKNCEAIKHLLFGFSLLSTILYQLFLNWFKGNTALGALLKEEFDLIVFDLPRKFMLSKPDPIEMSRLADEYRGNDIKDWYSPNISGNIPKNIIIAICQRISCKWDVDLRIKFNTILIGFICAHFIIILILCVFVIKNLLGTFLLMFSLTSVYTYFINIIRGNFAVISKREKIINKLEPYITEGKEITISNLRDVQDEILITRQESAKVPNFYFNSLYPTFRKDYEKYIITLNKSYNKA